MAAGEPKVWVGVNVGKGFHRAVGIGEEGEVLFSRRVENEEADLAALAEEALAVAGAGGPTSWAVDQPGGGTALLLAVLWGRGQRVLFVPGIAVDRARDGMRAEAKTDRKDARVIAEQARVRRDLKPLEPAGELLAEMRLLLSRRRDLIADQSRAIARLRDALVALCFRGWSAPWWTCGPRGPWSCSGATRRRAPSAAPGARGSRRTSRVGVA